MAEVVREVSEYLERKTSDPFCCARRNPRSRAGVERSHSVEHEESRSIGMTGECGSGRKAQDEQD